SSAEGGLGSISRVPASEGGGGSVGTSVAGEYAEAYFKVDELNSGLPKLKSPPNLSTPQATIENFVLSARRGDFDLAAYSLNLSLTEKSKQAREGAILASELFEVLERKIVIDWDLLPDRADGQIDLPRMKSDPLAGVPRRSIELGSTTLEGRDVTVRLQRVKTESGSPVWVFSPNTVENIPALYERYGPSPMEAMMPGFLKNRAGSVAIWEWMAFAGLIIVAFLIAWLASKLAKWLGRWGGTSWKEKIVDVIKSPLILLLASFFLLVTSESLLTLSGPVAKYFTPLLLFVLIASATWLGMRVLGLITDSWGAQYEETVEESDDEKEKAYARSVMTRLSVARRVLILFAVVVGAAVMVTQLNLLESFGGSLVLSAGVMTLVLGFAARNVLGNVMAGIQIAISQPVRIGDSILFEGTWGWIEEITYTYVGIRTWKKQRLIVPLEYFVSHPFENWTKKDTHLIKEVHLRADYAVPVNVIREKFEEVLKAEENWDEEVPPKVQVTGIDDESVDVRLLASAKDPSIGWDMHCSVREKMLDFLQGLEGGKYLPRRRLSMVDGGGPTTAGDGSGETSA
ncbi:MAG: mechanosensitive ion channel domain-containing protein, partial [Chthoniobacterales bacterium]